MIFFMNSHWRSNALKPEACTVTINVKGSSGNGCKTRVEEKKQKDCF